MIFSAAYVGFLDGIKLLHIFGANPNAQDKSGWTALMIASYEGHYDVVEYLLNQYKADISLRDSNGKRAFDKAKTSQIQYILSSAAIELRMRQNFESRRIIQRCQSERRGSFNGY